MSVGLSRALCARTLLRAGPHAPSCIAGETKEAQDTENSPNAGLPHQKIEILQAECRAFSFQSSGAESSFTQPLTSEEGSPDVRRSPPPSDLHCMRNERCAFFLFRFTPNSVRAPEPSVQPREVNRNLARFVSIPPSGSRVRMGASVRF